MNQKQRLDAMLLMDGVYQKLLEEYREAEEKYLAVYSKLSVEEREAVERYISLGEELDHRRAMLALKL